MPDAPLPAAPPTALPEPVLEGEVCLPEPGPTAARARALRWLVRLRAALFVAALVAIAVYFSSVFGPGVRLAFFVVYGLMAAAYVAVYLYVLATRRASS